MRTDLLPPSSEHPAPLRILAPFGFPPCNSKTPSKRRLTWRPHSPTVSTAHPYSIDNHTQDVANTRPETPPDHRTTGSLKLFLSSADRLSVPPKNRFVGMEWRKENSYPPRVKSRTVVWAKVISTIDQTFSTNCLV